MKQFAFDVVAITRSLPRSVSNGVLARQLLRAATSVAANYRSAGRARSRREFVSRLAVANV
jgi:four helix bundle protein